MSKRGVIKPEIRQSNVTLTNCFVSIRTFRTFKSSLLYSFFSFRTFCFCFAPSLMKFVDTFNLYFVPLRIIKVCKHLTLFFFDQIHLTQKKMIFPFLEVINNPIFIF